ncbi:MAG TPA: hypothetical protein VF755_23740 [Catenuloplanes sp.]|jgi:hypothetical protein
MNATTDPIAAARAAALFVSTVSAADRLTGAQVRAAIRQALRTHGGTRGCVGDVAAAYGEHPELAAGRMRWARGVVDELYRRPVPAQRSTRVPGTSGAAADAREPSRYPLAVAA